MFMVMVMIIWLVGQANDAVDGEASEMLNCGSAGLERHGHVGIGDLRASGDADLQRGQGDNP